MATLPENWKTLGGGPETKYEFGHTEKELWISITKSLGGHIMAAPEDHWQITIVRDEDQQVGWIKSEEKALELVYGLMEEYS